MFHGIESLKNPRLSTNIQFENLIASSGIHNAAMYEILIWQPDTLRRDVILSYYLWNTFIFVFVFYLSKLNPWHLVFEVNN